MAHLPKYQGSRERCNNSEHSVLKRSKQEATAFCSGSADAGLFIALVGRLESAGGERARCSRPTWTDEPWSANALGHSASTTPLATVVFHTTFPALDHSFPLLNHLPAHFHRSRPLDRHISSCSITV